MEDVPLNAFAPEYLAALREREEPEGAEGERLGRLVLREAGGRFGLFKPWQSYEQGDAPEAEFENREDALLFLAARGALERMPVFEMPPEGGSAEGGFTVEKDGRAAGRIRIFSPTWVYAAHVLASVGQSPEDLASMMTVAGPSRQTEVGEILGRSMDIQE